MDTEIRLRAKVFRKMEDPLDPNSKHKKYVCYVQASSIPEEMLNWMQTNPREQNMKTNVAKIIQNSLKDNDNFHELNRGILISCETCCWDNKTEELSIKFTNESIHGNIDGGHTLKSIIEVNKEADLSNRYVFFEIFQGIDSPVDLAASRNTSVQVDQKSIAELEKSFEPFKDIFKDLPFSDRIQYKMNQNIEDDPIDIRELIAIILMFSQTIYPYIIDKTLNPIQPIQCYSGKEASLKKFLNPNKNASDKDQKKTREHMIEMMKPIIPDIFKLWELIETEYADKAKDGKKKLGSKKYTKYNDNKFVSKSFLEQKDMKYYIPKGIMYPIVGAFRALVDINKNGLYSWKRDPFTIWDELGSTLVCMLLEERVDNPDVIAKNTNLWSNLSKEVYINAWIKN